MNRFRLFLHAFGIHYWTKWSEPREEEKPSMADIIYGGTSEFQKRRCEICNKVKYRTIYS